MNQVNLLSLTHHQFVQEMIFRFGKGKFHAGKLYSHWIRRGAIEDLSWVEPEAYRLVQQMIQAVICHPSPVSHLLEEGNLKKFLLKLEDGYETESVIIPMNSGLTLCVSSQVGCRMGCAFCETGKMGLIRSLTPGEITQQLFVAQTQLQAPIRNIVFMGMGEPFDNYESVLKAIDIMMDPKGFGIGPRHITVSTSGKGALMEKFLAEADPKIHLAISINAPNDAIRSKIMPVTKESSLEEIKNILLKAQHRQKRTFLIEYVLLEGINDALHHADELAHYLKGLKVKINLIPYNAQSKARFKTSNEEVQKAFFHQLKQHGYQVLLRHHKGRQVMAACGQLGNKEQRLRMFNGK